jgi:hypothetical protein
MGAIKDLWQSERGLVAIALIIATTVMFALHSLTTEQWIDATRWVFITYAAAKTITSSVALAKGPPPLPGTATGTPGPQEDIGLSIVKAVMSQLSADGSKTPQPTSTVPPTTPTVAQPNPPKA